MMASMGMWVSRGRNGAAYVSEVRQPHTPGFGEGAKANMRWRVCSPQNPLIGFAIHISSCLKTSFQSAFSDTAHRDLRGGAMISSGIFLDRLAQSEIHSIIHSIIHRIIRRVIKYIQRPSPFHGKDSIT